MVGKQLSNQNYVCYRQHKRTIVETALHPNILFRKRITSVPLHVSDPIFKFIYLSIYGDLFVDLVFHTENAVSALHKRNKLKRTHNIVPDRRKTAEFQYSVSGEVVDLNVQSDTFI